MSTVPQLVQYQGSKRKLAPQILQYLPVKMNKFIEPFSGMAAMTMAVSSEGRANQYIINDINAPLVGILQCAIDTPDILIKRYSELWKKQFEYKDHTEHFYKVRDEFNSGNQSPENMLYLIARCVKGSIRYGKNGLFNQSPDKRRHGTNPENIEKNVYAISGLLKGKASFYHMDYKDIFFMAETGDVIYMDPPYQGVSNVRDNRYYAGLSFEKFVNSLYYLNEHDIDYIISYDGKYGDKEYGSDLPDDLECAKILLNAGISTQATLLGDKLITYESLYVSRGLQGNFRALPKQLCLAGF